MIKKMVISEWYDLTLDQNVIQESINNPDLPLIIPDKLLQKANVKNANGRIYPKDVLIREVEKYKKLVDMRGSMGELDHPDSPIIELKNVSHIISDIYLNGDEVRGSLEVLNTPPGKTLRSLLLQGVKIGVSSRGVGSLQKEGDVNVVQNDFELIAFDAVSSPSTPGAYLVENIQYNIDRFNNLRNILHGILKDSYFD